MNPCRPAQDAFVWSERYERLRQHALGGPQPEAELLGGLDVLLQAGVAAWMGSPPGPLPSSGGSKRLWACCSEETVLLLADMAIGQLSLNQPRFNPKGIVP